MNVCIDCRILMLRKAKRLAEEIDAGFFVTGEVRNAGAYGWFPGLTARQLISLAGGLTPDGSNSRLKVVRQLNGQSKESGIKLDAPIKPGDTLVVRRRLF